MEAVDIEARTIDEAIEKACRQFQTTRDKLKIDIIAEGNPGFLGFGSKKALIRACLLSIDRELDELINRPPATSALLISSIPPGPKPTAPAPAVRPTVAPAPAPVPSSASAPTETSAASDAGAKGSKNPSSPDTSIALRTTRSQTPTPGVRPAQPKKPHMEKPARTEGGRDGNSPKRQPEKKQTREKEPASQAPTETPKISLNPQPEAIQARDLLEGILQRMNIPTEVRLLESEDSILLQIRGDGNGLLIGKNGQNLDAIQYIVNKAVHRSANDSKRVVIDTEEYRKRRETSLIETALQTAQKVRKTHKPVTLGPMNPHDRRIIHLALKNDKSLNTKSRGEGDFRKIVILPARRASAADVEVKDEDQPPPVLGGVS